MTFDDILGHQHLKKYLKESIQNKRIAHTQLFVGSEGSGALAMAIAYATEIICSSGNENSLQKCLKLAHPDMHFAFPVAVTDKVKKDPVSSLFMEEWRKFVFEKPYGDLFDWYQYLGIEKKQGVINVNQAREISADLALKSFEGGYKIMIIWMPELMNTECGNRLLKILEEPPAQTVFLLVCQDENQILNTIRSRCQITHIHKFGDETIIQELTRQGVAPETATQIAIRSQGNLKKALDFLQTNTQETLFEQWFVQWVRTAFRAKGNKASIIPLLRWSKEIAKEGRETQKKFLEYCIEVFRQAMLLNYNAPELIYIRFSTTDFKLENFAPFVHHNNIEDIYQELEKAIFHVERNGNINTILTDMSIKLTRLLHTKR